MAETKKSEGAATFAAAQRQDDGKKAMAEYEAAATALRIKTERLRAERLAREAAIAKAPKPAPKKKVAAAAKAGKTSKTGKAGKKGSQADNGTLSAWLDEQEKGGRRA